VADFRTIEAEFVAFIETRGDSDLHVKQDHATGDKLLYLSTVSPAGNGYRNKVLNITYLAKCLAD
jgi:hypothetical protein